MTRLTDSSAVGSLLMYLMAESSVAPLRDPIPIFNLLSRPRVFESPKTIVFPTGSTARNTSLMFHSGLGLGY